MLSMKWTERFIAQLESMTPPLVGVVGPTHSGGNTAILTYDFVHRRHVEIFGFYYPRYASTIYHSSIYTEKLYFFVRKKIIN